MKRRVGFLCGAPRVSTLPDAEVSGSRARLVGMLKSFEAMNWEIKPYIIGDRVSRKLSGQGSEKLVSGNFLKTLAVDFARLILGGVNAWKSWRELGQQVDWVFEYAAALQCLGWIFQRNGIPWILQTEAPLFYEAKVERKALILSKLAEWMEVSAYKNCDVLVCVSDTLQDIVVKELGVSRAKTVVVPNGVDTDLLNPQNYASKRLFSGFTVGFVGSLYAWAGLDLLLEALAELRQEGLEISLTIVGDGTMRRPWESLAEELGIQENVAFVGRISWQDVPPYIAGFDVGFSGQIQLQMGKMYLSPVKLYEYMAMAKPAIASAFDEAKRVVTDGQTGFLFQPGDRQDLKRSLRQAVERRSQLPELGQQARTHIIQNHSWAARGKFMIESIDCILAARSSPVKN